MGYDRGTVEMEANAIIQQLELAANDAKRIDAILNIRRTLDTERFHGFSPKAYRQILHGIRPSHLNLSEPLIVKSTLLRLLACIVRKDELAANGRVLQTVPFIAKILTENNISVEVIKECYYILERVASKALGVDALIRSGAIKYLCFAVGRFTKNSDRALSIVTKIALDREERIWQHGNCEGLNYILCSYADVLRTSEQIWEIFSKVHLIIKGLHVRSSSVTLVDVTRRRLLQLTKTLINQHLDAEQFNLLLKFTLLFMKNIGVRWYLEEDSDFLFQLVHKAAERIRDGLSNKTHREILDQELLLGHCFILFEMRLSYMQSNPQQRETELDTIAAMKEAIQSVCQFIKMGADEAFSENDNAPIFDPPFLMILSIRVLGFWLIVSSEPVHKEIAASVKYLYRIGRGSLARCQDNAESQQLLRQSKQQLTNEVIYSLILIFKAVMNNKSIMAYLFQQRIFELIVRYVDLNWVIYIKALPLIDQEISSQRPQEAQENSKPNGNRNGMRQRGRKRKHSTSESSSVDSTTSENVMRIENNITRSLLFLEERIGIDQSHVSSREMCTRLYDFTKTSLQYFTLTQYRASVTFHCINFGLTIREILGYYNEFIAVEESADFVTDCVNILRRSYSLEQSGTRQASLVLAPCIPNKWQDPWEIWSSCMIDMSMSVFHFPMTHVIIEKSNWLEEILQMRKDATVGSNDKHLLQDFDMLLEACAKFKRMNAIKTSRSDIPLKVTEFIESAAKAPKAMKSAASHRQPLKVLNQ